MRYSLHSLYECLFFILLRLAAAMSAATVTPCTAAVAVSARRQSCTTPRAAAVPFRRAAFCHQQLPQKQQAATSAAAAITLASISSQVLGCQLAEAAPADIAEVAWGFDGNFGSGEIVVGINLLLYVIYLAVVQVCLNSIAQLRGPSSLPCRSTVVLSNA